MTRRLAVGRMSSRPVAVWAVKHLVSPLDRFIVRVSRGRLAPPSSIAVPTLLLTTIGRRSGQERTTPLIYVRDGDRYIVANARPAGERRNPWALNLRAAQEGRIKVRGEVFLVAAEELDRHAIERWWPALVEVWPAFGDHFAATGERAVFVLKRQPPADAAT